MYSPFELLTHLIFTEPQDSVNYIIASAILANRDKIEELSTTVLAELCNVSKPTIVRFCRNLGYKDYTQFRIALHQAPKRPLNQYQPIHNPEAFATHYFDDLKDTISWMKKELPRKELMQLAREISRCEHIYLFGNSQANSSACDFSRRLILQGKLPHVVSASLNQLEIIRQIEPNALIIVISVYGDFWTSYVQPDCFSQKLHGQKVYWLTCAPEITSVAGVDHIIRCSPRNDFAGGNLAIDITLNLLLQYCWQQHSQG